jgi:hypothetical protein
MNNALKAFQKTISERAARTVDRKYPRLDTFLHTLRWQSRNHELTIKDAIEFIETTPKPAVMLIRQVGEARYKGLLEEVKKYREEQK